VPKPKPDPHAHALLKLREIEHQEDMASRLDEYREDPVGYATEILQVRPTPDQCDILHAVRDNRRVAVMASHSVGKTFVAAIISSWWYDCWDEHITYITAPSWHQALSLTFNQLKLLRWKVDLPGEIGESGYVRDPDRRKQPVHSIRVLNAEKGENFQGEHKAPILIIGEEATGIPGYIFQAAEGLMTGEANRMLVVGNPTDQNTPFGEACSSPLWTVLSISALNHPNIIAELHGDYRPYPGNDISLRWISEMLERECEVVDVLEGDNFSWWSPDTVKAALNDTSINEYPEAHQVIYRPSPEFLGRVHGRFPGTATNQVIPPTWLAACSRIEILPDWVPEVGCDVARFGTDRTTIASRRGPCLLSLDEFRKYDTNQVAEQVEQVILREAARSNFSPYQVRTKIDTTGGLGAGPYDILASKGYLVEAVNSSASANDLTVYRNRRSELWFDTRELVRTRELTTPHWRYVGSKKYVEDKGEMKKKLKWSPDLADAVNLAYAPPARVIAGAETEVEEYYAPRY
jgi:phage terminase large subunit